MAEAVSRLDNAIDAIRDAMLVAGECPELAFDNDDDLIDDLGFDEFSLQSLQLILEEIFSISVPDDLWRSPLHRTAASLAEYCINRANEAAWTISRSGARPRAAGCA